MPPHDLRRGQYHPVRLLAGDVRSGPRIGGLSPDIDLAGVPAGRRYLLTIPHGVERELSVFIDCDFHAYYDNRNLIHGPHNGMMTLVGHPLSARRKQATPRCNLAGGGRIAIGDPQPEGRATWFGARPIESDHKMGGRPWFDKPQLTRDGAALFRDRAWQLLFQLNFPHRDDTAKLDLDWPFGNGIFYLFTRGDEVRCAWS